MITFTTIAFFVESFVTLTYVRPQCIFATWIFGTRIVSQETFINFCKTSLQNNIIFGKKRVGFSTLVANKADCSCQFIFWRRRRRHYFLTCFCFSTINADFWRGMLAEQTKYTYSKLQAKSFVIQFIPFNALKKMNHLKTYKKFKFPWNLSFLVVNP